MPPTENKSDFTWPHPFPVNELKRNPFCSALLVFVFCVSECFAQIDDQSPEADKEQQAVDAASAQKFKIPTIYFQRAEGAPTID